VPTIGVDFKVKTLEINNKKVKMQIWDTAGEERFRTVVSTYFRGAHGILLLYDVTNRDSFKNLENWLIEIEKNSSEKVLKILLGNKCDLNDDREIQPDEGRAFADRNGMEFMETSAKMNTNVNEAFETLGKLMIEFNSKNNNKTQQGENKTFKADSGKDLNTKKKCC
jgi:Ras-related protein Rab-1A